LPFQIAARFADRQGEAGIRPEHLLYGVLLDARDPVATELGHRRRRELAALGWNQGRPNPLRLVLEARGVDLNQLAGGLGAVS
jgi:hypothetical protein